MIFLFDFVKILTIIKLLLWPLKQTFLSKSKDEKKEKRLITVKGKNAKTEKNVLKRRGT